MVVESVVASCLRVFRVVVVVVVGPSLCLGATPLPVVKISESLLSPRCELEAEADTDVCKHRNTRIKQGFTITFALIFKMKSRLF